MDTENQKPPKSPIPAWGYVFAGACGILPVLTVGGAIPGAVGFGGAAACISISRDPSKSVAARVAICAAIAVVCWLAVGALVLWMATKRHGG
jgi:hypothetical protein